MANIPETPYEGNMAVPLRLTNTPDGTVEVTSTHFPGKIWTGKDEQTAIRAQQVDVKEMFGKRTIQDHQQQPTWMKAELAKKAEKGLRVPEKSKLP